MTARTGAPAGLRAGRALPLLALAAVLAGAVACAGPDETTEEAPPGLRDRPAAQPGERPPERFGFGEPAPDQLVERWDVDVGPEGEGLPAGEGTAAEGARVWDRSCARCHGATGTEGPYDVLVGAEPRDSFPFGRRPELVSTIGNYWPYATTVFDYTRRAMPFDDPGSLTDDEVYAVTAWLLWRNELIEEDATMNAETLPAVEMPAREHFVPSEDVPLEALP